MSQADMNAFHIAERDIAEGGNVVVEGDGPLRNPIEDRRRFLRFNAMFATIKSIVILR